MISLIALDCNIHASNAMDRSKEKEKGRYRDKLDPQEKHRYSMKLDLLDGFDHDENDSVSVWSTDESFIISLPPVSVTFDSKFVHISEYLVELKLKPVSASTRVSSSTTTSAWSRLAPGFFFTSGWVHELKMHN